MSELDKETLLLLGELHGGMKAIQDSLRRLETAQDRAEANVTQQIGQLREDLNKRIDGIGTRVATLEQGEKALIEKTSRLSALGGGIGGILATAAVELMKRMS